MTFITYTRKTGPQCTEHEKVDRQVAELMPLCWPVNVLPLFQAPSAIYHLQAGKDNKDNTKASKAKMKMKTKLQMKQKHFGLGKQTELHTTQYFPSSSSTQSLGQNKGPPFRQFVKSPPQLQLFDFGWGNIKVNEFTAAIVC